jgi:hypothetical protein
VHVNTLQAKVILLRRIYRSIQSIAQSEVSRTGLLLAETRGGRSKPVPWLGIVFMLEFSAELAELSRHKK